MSLQSPAGRPGGLLQRCIPPPRALYGCFAFVMATGIVSIAAGLVGFGRVSDFLFLVNLAVFPVLSTLLVTSLLLEPASIVADLRDHRVAPRMLTVVAAICVLGNEFALTSGHRAIAVGLWLAAAFLWLGLVYCLFAVMTTRPEKPPLETGLDGSWLLLVVSTEALAILTTRVMGAAVPPGPALFASLCLFLLGGAFYAILLVLIVYRWLFLPMRPDQLTPAYWINMGAAAIAALAGTRLLETIGGAMAATPARGVIFAATILFWALATWWIPLLAALTLWRHRSGAIPLPIASTTGRSSFRSACTRPQPGGCRMCSVCRFCKSSRTCPFAWRWRPGA